MLALIRSALEGLVAVRDLVQLIIEGNVLSRLAALEKKQENMTRAFNSLAQATTKEGRAHAIAQLADTWNK
jgi:hypothetical protein